MTDNRTMLNTEQFTLMTEKAGDVFGPVGIGFVVVENVVETYWELQQQHLSDWKVWLANEYASKFTPEQQEAIFVQAWKDSSGESYEDVEQLYESTAKFIVAFNEIPSAI